MLGLSSKYIDMASVRDHTLLKKKKILNQHPIIEFEWANKERIDGQIEKTEFPLLFLLSNLLRVEDLIRSLKNECTQMIPSVSLT